MVATEKCIRSESDPSSKSYPRLVFAENMREIKIPNNIIYMLELTILAPSEARPKIINIKLIIKNLLINFFILKCFFLSM